MSLFKKKKKKLNSQMSLVWYYRLTGRQIGMKIASGHNPCNSLLQENGINENICLKKNILVKLSAKPDS